MYICMDVEKKLNLKRGNLRDCESLAITSNDYGEKREKSKEKSKGKEGKEKGRGGRQESFFIV